MNAALLAERLSLKPPEADIEVVAIGSSCRDVYSPYTSPLHEPGAKQNIIDDDADYLSHLLSDEMMKYGVETHHGGDGANGSAGLSGEGMDVTFIGIAGKPEDAAEKLARSDLDTLGVHDARIPSSRVATSIVERQLHVDDDGPERVLRYGDRYVKRETAAAMGKLITKQHLKEHFTGKDAILIASPKSPELLKSIFQAAEEAEVPFIALNPGASAFAGNQEERVDLLASIKTPRPRVGETAHGGRTPRVGAMAANAHELRLLYGEKDQSEAALKLRQAELARDVGFLLCSDGENGATLVHNTEYVDDTSINLGEVLANLEDQTLDEGSLAARGLIRSIVRNIALADKININKLPLPYELEIEDGVAFHRFKSVKLESNEVVDTLGAGDALFSNFVRYYLLLTRAFAGNVEALGQAHVIAMSLAMYQGAEAVKYVGAHAYRHKQLDTALAAK